MSTLHLLSKPPEHSNCLNSCLAVIGANDVLLLLGDGVYAGLPAYSDQLADIRCYALAADVNARGLQTRLSAYCTCIDDTQFVDLSTSCKNSQSWF